MTGGGQKARGPVAGVSGPASGLAALSTVSGPRPRAIAFVVRGPVAAADLPGLCARVCGLFGPSGARVAYCDVRGVQADAVAVDALARLQLAAGRHGCRVRLRNASPELRALVAFMGLTDVLPD